MEKRHFKEGVITIKDKISPSYINNTNPKYLEIDNTYYSGIMVVDFYREYTDLILKPILQTSMNMIVSMFYEKQDTYQTIKDLTYHIGNVGADMKEGNENREDIEIVAFTYQDAKYIRKQMQVNNEDMYFLYIYLMTYAESQKELEYYLSKLEGILQSYGLKTRRANFRQEACFIATTPLATQEELMKKATRRNVLTSGMVATYPFVCTSVYDENGIFIGTNIYNHSIILVDRYNKDKYKNANMCIFGTSGAGKSFYVKLLIMRYRLLGLEQYVIDPEREYHQICENLKGLTIKIGPSSNTYINIMEIREESNEDVKGYLANKISRLIAFFNLIFGEMNEEQKAVLEENLIECYKQKGITFQDESLYEEDKKKFKKSEKMPILEDFYKLLDESNEITKYFKIKLIPFVKGSLHYFNHHTNVILENKLIVADIYELGEENLKYGMYIFTELFWDKIKKNRDVKKAIYLDEIWRLIGVTSNKDVASFIYKIFKTIRKYGGSSVAITQDVFDLFSLENGTYGRSILNNSSIKTFFSLEEENIHILGKYSNLSEKEKIEIKSLKRGEALMFIGEDHMLVKIEAAEIEKQMIEATPKEETSIENKR